MRTRRTILLMFLSVTAAMLGSCSKNESDDIEIINPDAGPDPETGNVSLYTKHDETGDNYTVSYKYHNDVVVLTPARQESYLVKVEADTILYFAENTPVNLLPQVGGLYSSAITDKLPYGLGNKVVSRAKVGDLYKVVTTGAALDEIFEELVWDAAIDMSLLNPVYTDSLGNVVETTKAWYDEESDSCYTIDPKEAATRGIVIGGVEVDEIPIPKMKKTGASIEGNLNCGAKVHCSGNVATRSFVFYMQPVLNMEITVNAVNLNNDDTKRKWDKFYLFKGKTPAIAPITIGPIVLRPFVGVECSLDIESSGKFSLTFGKTLSGRFGFWQNNPNKHYENTTPQANNNIFRNITLSGKIEPSVMAKFVFGCGLYTQNLAVTLDPYLKISGGAEFNADIYTHKPTTVEIKKEAFFKVAAGAEGELCAEWFGGLKWQTGMKLVETELFNRTWTLLPSIENKQVLRLGNASSRANKRGQAREDSPKYEAKFSLDSGLLSKFNEFYPALLVYQGDKLLSQEKLSRRYVAGQSDNMFDFGVYDIHLNKEYKFMPSVYYEGTYIPLDTIVYIDEVKALTGGAKDVKSTSATLECTFTNLPSWVEAGVKVWNDGNSQSYTLHSGETKSGENTSRTYTLTGLREGVEYKYCAFVRDGDDYFEGDAKTFKTLASEGCPDNHHPHMIDLGLPSGTKWSCMNVGAGSPEDYGDYFAWGETEPKSYYDWSTYKWCNGSFDTLTKYGIDSEYGTVDNKTVLDLEDDAAHVNWGGAWRMPTDTEQYELRNKCTWTWTTQNGVKGYKVTRPNGNSIFLPAAGYRSNGSLNEADLFGYYWSSSLVTSYGFTAYSLGFYSGYNDWNYWDRFLGHSVRPVCQ